MKRIILYIKESFNELVHKVSWPTWTDLQSNAIVVMIASLIISLIVFGMDFSFQHIVSLIYSIAF
jgi:preprotein translocase subunit SecE